MWRIQWSFSATTMIDFISCTNRQSSNKQYAQPSPNYHLFSKTFCSNIGAITLINRQYYIPCLKYVTDTYHILTEANDQEHPFARGLAFRRRFCPRALARGQKRRLKASPKAKGCSCSFGTRSGYDMYQSNISDKGCNIFYIWANPMLQMGNCPTELGLWI